MTLNDFKSVAGDSQMGIASLPVQLGVDGAARTACWVMAVPQILVIIALLAWGKPFHSIAVILLLLAQGKLMMHFIAAPVERALLYSGFGVPLLVAGMMVSAFALRASGL
jgi:chlorophyll synthase